MKFLRGTLGLAIAAIGCAAALVMLLVFFLFFPDNDTPVVRLGWAVSVAFVEGLIFAAAFYAFRKVVGPRPRNRHGGTAT
jgi:hypothetical protein